MSTLRLLDLFSGIGGFSRGLERSGAFRTVAFCEIEPYCCKVLAKHWPDVPIYDDVRSLTAERLRTDGIAVDAICGGFPCQDISYAGRGAGIEGSRSGLWSEFARLIGAIRPTYVVLENSAALLARGMGRILRDLAVLRYDAEWHCISSADIGAPHKRERIWLVAYPEGVRQGQLWGKWCETQSKAPGSLHWPEYEPPSERVAHGLSDQLHRVTALGNAVVPQIPELIGRAIIHSMREVST
jgi:DNA (cytosine-5)-methyltransferase 1